MRMTIKETVDQDFMGGKTVTRKIVIDGADEGDLLRLLSDAQQTAGRRLGGPVNFGDTGAIEVTDEMAAAARRVFLSPERIEALRETLGEVYRAMERARRAKR